MAQRAMALCSSHSFQKFTLYELPLQRDTWVMDEQYMEEWERVWLESMGDDENASPYQVG